MIRIPRAPCALLALSLAAPAALAQFNNDWVEFTPASGRIVDSNGASAIGILNDGVERDFAAGDLNGDGWTDLVIVRKTQALSFNPPAQFLLMNEGGILVDRTAQFASASDVPGGLGFFDQTTNRSAQIVDVNLDGWPDLVTCGFSYTPRVYINQGRVNGVWLGLRHEQGRIPPFAQTPFFNAVAVGDVDGDGAPDLYLANAGFTGDRLLMNDGNGNFSDSGTTRLTTTMLMVGESTSVNLLDMNMDGLLDVVRGYGGGCSIAYNTPATPGYFSTANYQVGVNLNGSTYNTDAGDLNRDGRPDVVFTDDGADNYRFNLSTNAQEQAEFGPIHLYDFLTGNDQDWGGSIRIADLDGDGWPETLHSSLDVSAPTCSLRLHIYHNLGGNPGDEIVLREEAESANSGWRGVKGMLPADMAATADVATLDLDNDGDLDLVLARCSGTFVWINQKVTTPTASTFAYGSTNANSTGQRARISASGTPGASVNDFVLSADRLPALKTTIFLYGSSRLWHSVPFGDGKRWVGPPIQRLPVVTSDASGVASFPCDFTSGPLSTILIGAERDAQAWFRDPGAGAGHSNTTPAIAFWRVD
ncbi:MAG: VCBS repeat-containing protein [Planctomycetes bacterium]|nr:VCBS repeat-containing protein [Planctomycetota bacterium]